MRFKLLKNFLLALPILAFSSTSFALYVVETAPSGDDTAAEVTNGSPDTAEFWIKAQPGGDTNNLIVGLTASGAAALTSDYTLVFPSSCEVTGSGTDTITFSANSTGANTYDMTLGGSALTCNSGGTVSQPCQFICVITINAVDDMIDEDTEGLNLALDPSPSVKNPKNQNFTISDNDTAALVVTDSNWNGTDPIVLTQKQTSETGTTDTFWVELATQPLSNITVDLEVNDTDEALISTGGAPAPTLELTFTTGNWNAGQEVTITGQDDAVQDGNTAYQVSVATTNESDDKYDNKSTGPVIGINADDDEPGQLRFTQSSQSGAEGDNLVLLVERINGSSSEVTIQYQITNGSASGSDYTDTTPSTTLTWGEGVSGTQSITINLENDTLWEPTTEDFTVALLEGTLTGGATLLTPNTQTVTINPSDPITITISGAVPDPVIEGTTGDNTDVEFEVDYTGGTLTSPLSISWATADGSATTADGDYDSAGASIDLPANGNPVTLTVNVNGDTNPEGNETFVVQLSESHDLVSLAGGGSSTATIQDDDAPDEGTFSITSITPNPVMESEGLVTVTVSRITAVDVLAAASVNIFTTDGTAVAGDDFVGTTLVDDVTLDWAVDDKADKTFDIVINDDEPGEPAEAFTVTIQAVAAEQIGTGSGVVTIIADPTVTFSPDNYTVSEDGGSVTVFVTRANVDDDAVSVDYTTTNGTATAGDDFTATSDTLNWAAGELGPKPINITILPDADEVGPESFTVDLSTCGNCTIIDNQATVTIEEGEVVDKTPGTLAFSPTLIQISEGGGTATVFVNRTGGTDGIVSIGWETQPGSATSPADFTASSGTLSWADGSGGIRLINVPITEDGVVEPTESFTVQFVPNSETGSEGDPTLGASSATVSITDNDSDDPGEFSVISKNVTEGDGVINISVTRDVGNGGAVSVDYTTTPGTALAGTDYTATNGTLNWADGDSAAKTIAITILDDAIVEPEEAFAVTLSNAQGGASINVGTADVTIFDNDGGGSFSISDTVVFEYEQQATVTVTRTNDNDSAASVFWQTFDGTAQDENGDNDYKSDSSELVWLDGDVSDTKTITIDIVTDVKVEGDEWFTVTITGVQGESVTVSKADGVVTIKDPIPIPTLNQWAMGLLVLLLLAMGAYSLPLRRSATTTRR